MRRTRLVPFVSAAVLVALLLPASALGLLDRPDHREADAAGASTLAPPASAVPARPSGTPVTPRAVEAATATPGGPVPIVTGLQANEPQIAAPRPSDRPAARIRLGCALLPAAARPDDPLAVRPDVAPAIACRWSAVEDDRLRGYQLWRAVDAPGGGPRRLVATIPAGEPLRYVDARVSRGHAYTYAVIAVARDGSKIGRGGPVVVRVPAPPDELRLACALATDGDRRGVACKWSAATHPAAAGYVLWRSVDDGPRERIYRAGLDGRRSFFDTAIKPGQTIRYAVIVVDRAGERVGRGGPVVVRVPDPAPVPIDGGVPGVDDVLDRTPG